MGAELNQAYWLAHLAEAYAKGRQVEAGLMALSEALSMMDKVGEHFYESEFHRLRGELLLQRNSSDEQQPETCFHHAITIARQQQAKSWELRAATSLARL
jgi:predicted ATPase